MAGVEEASCFSNTSEEIVEGGTKWKRHKERDGERERGRHGEEEEEGARMMNKLHCGGVLWVNAGRMQLASVSRGTLGWVTGAAAAAAAEYVLSMNNGRGTFLILVLLEMHPATQVDDTRRWCWSLVLGFLVQTRSLFSSFPVSLTRRTAYLHLYTMMNVSICYSIQDRTRKLILSVIASRLTGVRALGLPAVRLGWFVPGRSWQGGSFSFSCSCSARAH